MVDDRSEKGDEVGTINRDSVWGPDGVKSCSSPPWMWYALTLAIVYRSLGSWCPAMFACLVYSLDSPKGVRGQLCWGQDDFNMAHSSFLSCIKPTFVIAHGGGLCCSAPHCGSPLLRFSHCLLVPFQSCGNKPESKCGGANHDAA
jgi:hypothetical protein